MKCWLVGWLVLRHLDSYWSTLCQDQSFFLSFFFFFFCSYMVSGKCFDLKLIIYLHRFIWFQVSLSNVDNLHTSNNSIIIIIIITNKKKRICKVVAFAVPADHRIKLKECKKKDKSLDLTRELKKLWNMKVTIVPIVIGAFGTLTKGLLKGLEDFEVGLRVVTIQMTALLGTVRILRRVPETWGDLLSFKLQWKNIR